MARFKAPESVHAAVLAHLKNLSKADAALAGSPLAANALSLAREMDDDNSATSKSMCARALNETMDRLRELAPPEQTTDGVDELAAKRSKRLAGSAAAKG